MKYLDANTVDQLCEQAILTVVKNDDGSWSVVNNKTAYNTPESKAVYDLYVSKTDFPASYTCWFETINKDK